LIETEIDDPLGFGRAGFRLSSGGDGHPNGLDQLATGWVGLALITDDTMCAVLATVS